MKLGLSLSPGGLMLPYHMGVLQGLQNHPHNDNNVICPMTTPIAGSSAGAIATMAHGCGLDPMVVLEKTIQVSDRSLELGGARGRLLPLLQEQMDDLVNEEQFQRLEDHSHVGIAYTEVFPNRQSFCQTTFDSRQDLFQAVSWSCMFPFFATNFPCALDWTSTTIPRLMVDGFFSVPRERFGCPELPMAANVLASTISNSEKFDTVQNNDNNKNNDDDDIVGVDRTIAISAFPKSLMKIDAFEDDDCISPPSEMTEDVFRIATQASSREDLTMVYEQGIMDAEEWWSNELKTEKRRRWDQQELDRRKLH